MSFPQGFDHVIVCNEMTRNSSLSLSLSLSLSMKLLYEDLHLKDQNGKDDATDVATDVAQKCGKPTIYNIYIITNVFDTIEIIIIRFNV